MKERKNPRGIRMIDIPVIKQIKTAGILDPDNIIGYEPEPFLKEPKYKERFAVVYLKSFHSLINMSPPPQANRLTIEIKSMFTNTDQLLVVDKEGTAIVGTGFLKDSKTLLLKERFGSKELSVYLPEIIFMAKVKSSRVNSNI